MPLGKYNAKSRLFPITIPVWFNKSKILCSGRGLRCYSQVWCSVSAVWGAGVCSTKHLCYQFRNKSSMKSLDNLWAHAARRHQIHLVFDFGCCLFRAFYRCQNSLVQSDMGSRCMVFLMLRASSDEEQKLGTEVPGRGRCECCGLGWSGCLGPSVVFIFKVK